MHILMKCKVQRNDTRTATAKDQKGGEIQLLLTKDNKKKNSILKKGHFNVQYYDFIIN